MKAVLSLIMAVVLLIPSAKQCPIYQNPSYSFQERAADLVSRLTLEEKQSLLGNSMAAIPRLGIKSYNVWSEALHGLLASGNPNLGLDGPTSFPNSVALGATWDPDLMQREASAIADEARAFFQAGAKGLTFWSPVVEPIRDPRWGRTAESFGEDPFLVSQIAGGFVRGMVGSDSYYLKAVPCGKHYFANNSEFDRHVSSSNMDSRDMREYYLAPYKKLIEEDELPSIMSSYNAVNGVPTSASVLYLDSIARRTYGLNGYITGDCAAIEDIYTGHYYVETAAEATAKGLKAGVDSDCGSVYQRSTIEAYNKGLITMGDIDKALVNMFTIRMRTGEFDPDSKVLYSQYQTNMVNSPANRALAEEVATKTPVLMKNQNVVSNGQMALPLNSASIKKIALIGPQADKVELGQYSGRPEQVNMITPYAGIKQYFVDRGIDAEVLLSSGGNTQSKSNLFYMVDFRIITTAGKVSTYDATKYTSSSKGITVGSGMGSIDQVRTIDDGSWTAYENVDLTNIDSIGLNINIPTEGGFVEVRVGSQDGNLLATLDATVASGVRPGGVYGAGSLMTIKSNRLGYNTPQTLYLVYKAPKNIPIDDATLKMAKEADVAVVFVGTDENTATEEADRLTLLLPGNQVDLIKAVAAVNPYTIVVMQTLGCVEVEEFKNLSNIPGIIWTGYNGQAQGSAIARVLFGDVNPGGKLISSWYKSVNDLPEITDYTLRGGNGKNGRTLWYFDKEVSYEFGYGLSYTKFEYDNFTISKNSVTPNDQITISVDVKNTGDVDGDEVVQIYMRTPDSPASLERPIKRLKGFQRVTIPAGQTKTVSININCADLWFWDMKEDKITFDQGRYLFEIGSSSKDIRGTVSTTMRGSYNSEIKTVVADCGQIVLDKGETVKTRVTAAMSDDSFFDVSKAKVTYTSNNESIAKVDGQGIVTAVNSGVATITAHVTVNGKTEMGSYSIKVISNKNLQSITVGTKKISTFNPDTKSYSFLLKQGAAVPSVTAAAFDKDINVDISQVKALPGTATIAILDKNTLEENLYVVNFGTQSVNDEFKNSSLGNQWKWVRENSSAWSLSRTSGALLITGKDGDVTGESNNAENMLLQSANTDWTIDSKVTLSKAPSGAQNAGIIAYQDDDNFVKLVYGVSSGFGRRGFGRGARTPQQGNLNLIVEENGYMKTAATVSMNDIIKENRTVVLRIVKSGSKYSAFYSIDGKKYTSIGETTAVLQDIQAGLMACDGVVTSMGGFLPMPMMQQPNAEQPDTSPFEVAFDYFHIKNSGLK